MEEHSCQIEKSKNVDRMKEYENSISEKEKNIYERKMDCLKKRGKVRKILFRDKTRIN
jgi:hypothetical protein